MISIRRGAYHAAQAFVGIFEEQQSCAAMRRFRILSS
jgi:hypothetical protein